MVHIYIICSVYIRNLTSRDITQYDNVKSLGTWVHSRILVQYVEGSTLATTTSIFLKRLK